MGRKREFISLPSIFLLKPLLPPECLSPDDISAGRVTASLGKSWPDGSLLL